VLECSLLRCSSGKLIRVSDRWSRVPVPNLERQQLRLLGREVGIDPDPSAEKTQVRGNKRTAA
jgi:hypothetical protein